MHMIASVSLNESNEKKKLYRATSSKCNKVGYSPLPQRAYLVYDILFISSKNTFSALLLLLASKNSEINSKSSR